MKKSLSINVKEWNFEDFQYVIKDTASKKFKEIVKILDEKLFNLISKKRLEDPIEFLVDRIGGNIIENIDDLIIYCNKTKKEIIKRRTQKRLF